ncbi:hypothetical protein [Vreelandella sp. GE22]
MKHQEQFLTIWDTPATQATRSEKTAPARLSFTKRLAALLVALKS